MNVKFPNNISEWQMGFNSAFKGLNESNKRDTLLTERHKNSDADFNIAWKENMEFQLQK